MSAERIDLTELEDARDGIHRVVQAIAEGATVLLPMASGPEACRLATSAVPERTSEIAGVTQSASLLFASLNHAADFLPRLTTAQIRLLRRTEPGTVVFQVAPEADGPLAELPDWVTAVSMADDHLAIRLTDSPVVEAVLSLLPGPVVCGAESQLGSATLELVDGAEPTGEPTVVRFRETGPQLIHQGVIDADEIRELMGVQVLLICTGNTCRSPMGEVALKGLLAEQLGVSVDELEDRGITVHSAGIAARGMSPASEEAVLVAAEHGLNLSRHRSQPASLELILHADAVFTMTQGHRASIVGQVPELGPHVQVLAPDGRDVDDPIGGPVSAYQACFTQIQEALKQRLPELTALIESSQESTD